MQVQGLISGLDTGTLISQLMAIERRPVTLMQTRQDALKTCQGAWSDLKVKLNELKGAVADLKLTSTFGGRVVDSSDSKVVTAEATTAASLAQYSITVSRLAQSHKVASDRQASTTTPLGVTGTFYIDATPVTVTAEDSLGDIRNSINSAGAGVVATVVDNTLLIARSETGATQISLADDLATDVLTALGVLDSGDAIKHEVVTAQDALFTLDGLEITRSSNTVSDVLTEVTLKLIDDSPTAATLTVEADTDKALSKVKTLVEKYNAALSAVNVELAQGGRLRGDATLAGIQIDLRKTVSDAVAGLPSGYDRLSAVGIASTGSSGALALDEAKFRGAYEADPSALADLFTLDGEGMDGVAVRLYVQLDSLTRTAGLIPSRYDGLQRRIDDLGLRMAAFEKHLAARESSLTARFREMELMMSHLSNQSNWLRAQSGT